MLNLVDTALSAIFCATKTSASKYFNHSILVFKINDLFFFLDGSRSKRSGENDAAACKESLALLQADLQFGTLSGKFTHHEHAKTLEQCKSACCRRHGCDVAYMKGSRCYSVDCKDEKSCLWVDASDRSEPIKLVYITHTDVKAHLSKGTLNNKLCIVRVIKIIRVSD